MARKWCFKALVAVSLCLAASGCQTQPFTRGDLLFHVVASGNAITDVTPGMIDHVAICLGADSVVEAIPHKGVVVTPIDTLRQREAGYYIIGKVRKADRQASVSRARRYLGRRYDALFLADNEDIYCSELVQLSFVNRKGEPLFAPIPMSFHDATGRITPYWQQFYEQRGLSVPEGQPGTNPGELSRRQCIRLTGRLQP